MITVAIIDDHKVLIDALEILFQSEPEIKLVGSACTLAEGLKVVQRTVPCVLLLDSGLPDGGSLDSIQKLQRSSPNTNIILLTSLSDEAIMVQAIRNGVTGFFSKGSSVAQLLDTIRKAAAGEMTLPTNLLAQLLRRVPRNKSVIASDDQLWEQLTSREIEILSYLAQGKSGKDIAATLNITPLTVRTHVRNMMAKMGVHSRLEAVSFGLRHGLISA